MAGFYDVCPRRSCFPIWGIFSFCCSLTCRNFFSGGSPIIQQCLQDVGWGAKARGEIAEVIAYSLLHMYHRIKLIISCFRNKNLMMCYLFIFITFNYLHAYPEKNLDGSSTRSDVLRAGHTDTSVKKPLLVCLFVQFISCLLSPQRRLQGSLH